MGREQQLAEALVGLADPLADDIDPVVLVERLARNCVDITEADAVGIMVVSGRGDLRTLAVTEEDAGALEFFQLQADEGPCLESFREDSPPSPYGAVTMFSTHHDQPGHAYTGAELGALDRVAREAGAWLDWYRTTTVRAALEELHRRAQGDEAD
ncbi:hypothetical protein ACWCQS_19490 [Streptomyces sp. NPDC002076]